MTWRGGIHRARVSLRRRVRDKSLVLNYTLGRYHPVVWLIGDGRSGTTWIASLINHQGQFREMFEPFHPRFVPAMRGLRPNHYLRPDATAEDFQETARSVFSGRLRHPRVDQDNTQLLYRGLLVKDVFANLLARWASLQFPEIRAFLLVRNPFAVASSKLEKREWFWQTDPRDFLQQPALMDDHLRPHRELIERVGHEGDFIERQVLIWAILNYVPLRQFPSDALPVIFYEDALLQPEREVQNVLAGLDRSGTIPAVTLPEELVRQPSRVSRGGTPPASAEARLEAWRTTVTPSQIRRGLDVLACFGLDRLYGDGVQPARDVIDDIRSKGVHLAR